MKLYDVTPAEPTTAVHEELKFVATAKCEFCSSLMAVTPIGTQVGTPLSHAQLELVERELEEAECPECHCSSTGYGANNIKARKNQIS